MGNSKEISLGSISGKYSRLLHSIFNVEYTQYFFGLISSMNILGGSLFLFVSEVNSSPSPSFFNITVGIKIPKIIIKDIDEIIIINNLLGLDFGEIKFLALLLFIRLLSVKICPRLKFKLFTNIF